MRRLSDSAMEGSLKLFCAPQLPFELVFALPQLLPSTTAICCLFGLWCVLSQGLIKGEDQLRGLLIENTYIARQCIKGWSLEVAKSNVTIYGVSVRFGTAFHHSVDSCYDNAHFGLQGDGNTPSLAPTTLSIKPDCHEAGDTSTGELTYDGDGHRCVKTLHVM